MACWRRDVRAIAAFRVVAAFVFFAELLCSLWRNLRPARRERTVSFRCPLKGTQPNCHVAPVGPPASGRESKSAPHNKRNIMPSKNAQNASRTKTTSGVNAPVQTFRLGRIKATIWENEADKKKYYNVTFARTYLGEDKQLHDAASFGRDQLPL